jgi:hypothetical protein
MKKPIFQSLLASLALGAMLVSATAQPAKADQAATTRILVGAAAVAAIATAINIQHKHQVANNVVGYLSDGSTVYQDGHVVSAQTGQSWYPGNYGQQVACSNNQCYVSANNAYNPNQNPGYGYNNGYNTGYTGSNGYRRRHGG